MLILELKIFEKIF